MITQIKCVMCNMAGGTVPLHTWDGVVIMFHDACAIKYIQRYMDRKESEGCT